MTMPGHHCGWHTSARISQQLGKLVCSSAACCPLWQVHFASAPRRAVSVRASWGGYAADGRLIANDVSSGLVNAQNKTYLAPGLRHELAQRLRTVTWEPLAPDGRDGRLLRVYRFAVDDLRLFKAIHEAGMLGRIVVVDRISDADIVLAAQRRRTGKESSLTPARNAALKAGLPYIELQTFSGKRLMEAVADLMGIPVPAHLLYAPQQPAATVMLRHNNAATAGAYPEALSLPMDAMHQGEVLAQTLLQQAPTPLPEDKKVTGEEGQPAAVPGATKQQKLGVPDIESLQEGDEQPEALNPNLIPAKQKVTFCPISHGSRARSKKAMKRLAEERAPW